VWTAEGWLYVAAAVDLFSRRVVWHRRHALQLASMLPDNASDANAIIRELQYLVNSCHPAAMPQPSKVLTLLRDQE